MKPSRPSDPLVEALIAKHDAVNAGHGAARSRLLNCLPPTPKSERSLVSPLGWIGLGTLAGAGVLMLWAIGTTSPAAAMERMAREVERVRSLSYRMDETLRDDRRERLVESAYEGKWCRQPLSLWGTMKIWVTDQAAGVGAGAIRKPTVDVWESHRADEEGVVIDHLRRRYWRTPPIDLVDGLGGDTPVAAILKVSQRRGRELRDLGVRRIAGRDARGVEILLDDSNPADAIEGGGLTAEGRPSEGALWRNERVEVWLDPESGLPVEFKSVRSGEGYEATIRYTDLEWNLDFPPKTFDPTTPEDYEELPESPFSE